MSPAHPTTPPLPSSLLFRFAGWRPSDILLLNQTVDARLIELFQYRPAVSSSVGEEEGEGRL